jgi:hypothetical protein
LPRVRASERKQKNRPHASAKQIAILSRGVEKLAGNMKPPDEIQYVIMVETMHIGCILLHEKMMRRGMDTR